MITSNLTGVVCGNSDVLLDQLIDEGVHFDLKLMVCKNMLML